MIVLTILHNIFYYTFQSTRIMKRIVRTFTFLITISVLLLLWENLVVQEKEKYRNEAGLGEEVHGLDWRNTERG